jgi:hypothetical protein
LLPPENPLFALRQIDKPPAALINKEISCDFYMICFKKLKSGEIWYGKTKYDHDKGFTFFMKPRQKISVYEVQFKENGFTIYFHQDFLMGHPLFK